MNLTGLHHRLLADCLAVGGTYPLVLAGGHVVQAHGLADRLSYGLDFATENPDPLERIAADMRVGLEQRGWLVTALVAGLLSAELIVADASDGEECEVGIRKEVLWRLPLRTPLGPALSVEDVVGTKVRALAALGLACDLIDVRAAPTAGVASSWKSLADGTPTTPSACPSFGRGWSVLTGSMTPSSPRAGSVRQETAALRLWPQEWADDIAERLLKGEAPPED